MDSGKPMTSKGFRYETLVLTFKRVINEKANGQKYHRVRAGTNEAESMRNRRSKSL